MMPRQLEAALLRRRYSKKSSPKPIVEQLERIDIADLCRWQVFPDQRDWHKAHLLEMPFRYPFVKSLVISLQNIEVNHHSGYNQVIPLRWVRTGFGGNYRPRPLFVCQCRRAVTKLYFRHFNLACRRCTNALYASQVCDKHSRPTLQALRLENLLKFKSHMGQRNRRRLIARIPKTHSKRLDSKRLKHHSIQLPQSNYRTRGAMHWR
jgi:hypothetical protein